jgi:hypothetical protein
MSTFEPEQGGSGEARPATWEFGGAWVGPQAKRARARTDVTTFRVAIAGVSTREQHDAIHASLNSALVRQLAAMDVAGTGARFMTSCTCSGNAGSGSSGAAREAATAAAPPTPLEYSPTALSRDQLGEFEFRLSGMTLSEDQIGAIEADIQQAVLPHLTTIDYGPGQVAVLIPHLHRLGSSAGMVFGPIDRTTVEAQRLLQG